MSGPCTDQPIFDAIAAATHFEDGHIVISVPTFIEFFNNHRDRALCTSLALQPDPLREEIARETLAETIHKARWPLDRVIHITPFADEDRNGREYCFRIADAILALLHREGK